ncbi:MAG: hypothetical protein NW208_01560 [Bryobacter sp.]|nr:hypothetical protein [Bryobacter sp.]
MVKTFPWVACVALLFFGTLLSAQTPFIAYRGVVNAASLAPPGLPHAGIARGSIFTIFGENLGPATPSTVGAFPLTPIFAGVGVSLVQGGVSVSAIPIFVSANQLNVILPSLAPLGEVLLRVSYEGRLSNAVPIRIVENSPGIFAVSSGGFGPGVIQNFVSAAVQPVNSLQAAAVAGQVITIWATGLGPAPFPDNVAPTATNLNFPITVTVGERPADVLYAGRSPCCAGVDQIVVRVPNDAPVGCYVPVRVKSGNGVSNTVSMAIRSGTTVAVEGRCEDRFNPFSALVQTPGRQGIIGLNRTNAYADTYTAAVEQNTFDSVRAYFVNRPASPFTFDPYYSLPPPGTCSLQSTSGNVFQGAPLRGSVPESQTLNAGEALRLVVSSGQPIPIPRVSFPQAGYAELVGSQRLTDGTGGLKIEFFNTTRIEGNANTAVGEFSAGINSTNLFNWAERPTLNRVSRTFPFRVFFTPSDGTAHSVLQLATYQAVPNASTLITCVAAPLVNNFAVPVDLLSHLLPSSGAYDGSQAVIAIGSLPFERAVPFTAPGLDAGLALFSQWQIRTTYIE